MSAKDLTSAFAIVIAAGAASQAYAQQYQSLGLENSALPEEVIADLFQIERGDHDAIVLGVAEPIPAPVMDAAQDLYQFTSPWLHKDAAARLGRLGDDYSIANTLLGGAVNLGIVEWEGGDLPLFLKGAQKGDVLAQHAVDRHYLIDGSGNLLMDRGALEELYLKGGAAGAETTLAQYYQYGVGGPADAVAAEEYWIEAVAGSYENPVTLFGYAQFLEYEGRSEEAWEYLSRAATRDYGPAVAKELRLARLGSGQRAVPEVLSQAERLGEAGDSAAALEVGDSYRIGSTKTDWLKAAEFYRFAMEGRADRDVYRAQAYSRLGQLYLDHPDLTEDFTQKNAEVLFSQAAGFGDPGGLLGLATLAYENEDYGISYSLASRTAELGDDGQIEKANLLRQQICKPGTWIDCVPVPVFFATTRQGEFASDGSVKYGNKSSPDGAVSFGVAFVQIPITSKSYQARQELYDAVTTSMAGKVAADGLGAVGAERDIAVVSFPNLGAVLKDLEQTADTWGVNDVFVYVHGFNTPFEGAVRAAAEVIERGGFPAIPIALDWSSRGNAVQYLADMAAADSSCKPLLEPLLKVGEAFGGDRMTLLAHSMGAQVVYSMIGGCRGDNAAYWNLTSKIENLIYAAPDMTRADFINSFGNQAERASHITLYATAHDAALSLSQSAAYNDVPRAGIGGNGFRVLIDRLNTIDATRVEAGLFSAGDIWNHGYVFSRPEVVHDLRQLMNGDFEPSKRTCLEADATAAPSYWWVTQGCVD